MTEKDTETTGTPRWVKVFGIIALALVVLVIVVLIADRGGHGPGRHARGATDPGTTSDLPLASHHQP